MVPNMSISEIWNQNCSIGWRCCETCDNLVAGVGCLKWYDEWNMNFLVFCWDFSGQQEIVVSWVYFFDILGIKWDREGGKEALLCAFQANITLLPRRDWTDQSLLQTFMWTSGASYQVRMNSSSV